MSTNVYLDAGHGGYDNGSTYNGRKEKDDNLKLATAVAQKLRENGVETNLTRTTDVYQSPNEKAQIANENEGDLFISFHRSSSPVPNSYDGVEAYIYSTGGDNESLAKSITSNLSKLGFKDLGVRVNKNLTVLKKTNMPAILLDVGFINTDTDNEKFDDKFDEIVNVIANSIMDSIDMGGESGEDKGVEYTIQVGLFKNAENAENLVSQLEEDGIQAQVTPMGGYTAVTVGIYKTVAAANKVEEQLTNMGYETIVIER